MSRPKGSQSLPTFGTPAKPAHLSEQAGREWDRLIREIQESGLQVTPAHRALIALAATLHADIKSDCQEIPNEAPYYSRRRAELSFIPPSSARWDLARSAIHQSLCWFTREATLVP